MVMQQNIIKSKGIKNPTHIYVRKMLQNPSHIYINTSVGIKKKIQIPSMLSDY